ncbi:neuropeptide-like 2 isoform X2 [Drosophila elegans]|uniref:neuropeptide-like 2 isoform X2 n=1 Tax=Drosophila elegans TaxID=30023 RepID=UPI0007E601D8|nr:neuropeptide-like 2 isoform X2 [Drosophila elegans]
MAKIAVIFLLFALLAVAMSARIAREEPTTSPVLRAIDKVKEDLNSITSDFNKITSEQFRVIRADITLHYTRGFRKDV